MAEPARELARRDDRLSTLERVLGTGDMAQMIEATKANVNAAIQFAREREFVSEYPIVRKGKQVGVRLWFHHPTWQLLGQSFGITAYTDGEPHEVKPGTWQAAAVAALIEDGRVIGRAVGLCSRSEPGKQKDKNGNPVPEHNLSATAQARAQRNALRSALGAVLIAAGFEISDPEGPITKEQIGMLHQLERELGWDHDQGHVEAGDVASFKDLTREQASEVIDRWTALRDNVKGGGGPETPHPRRSPSATTDDSLETDGSSGGGAPGKAAPSAESFGEGLEAAHAVDPGVPDLDGPATPEQWERALKAGLTERKAVPFAKTVGITVKSAAELTQGQLGKVLTAWLERKG
jgi:hypothetical protein